MYEYYENSAETLGIAYYGNVLSQSPRYDIASHWGLFLLWSESDQLKPGYFARSMHVFDFFKEHGITTQENVHYHLRRWWLHNTHFEQTPKITTLFLFIANHHFNNVKLAKSLLKPFFSVSDAARLDFCAVRAFSVCFFSLCGFSCHERLSSVQSILDVSRHKHRKITGLRYKRPPGGNDDVVNSKVVIWANVVDILDTQGPQRFRQLQ